MLAVLVVFALTIYVLTGSLWTAFWQTIACAVLLQVGYFIGVLWMVWRASQKPGAAVAQDEAVPRERQDPSIADRRKVPSSSFPHRP